MSDSNSISSADTFSKFQLKQESVDKQNELGKTQFLELMVTQLNNQDPLSPQDNSEFVAQLAQFSSVEGIENLNNSVDSLATSFQSGQALQASSLVGRSVHVNAKQTILEPAGIITGTLSLPASVSNLRLEISDQNGALVRSIELGENAAGEIDFGWDGSDKDGNALPPGLYSFRATAPLDGANTELDMQLSANVNSVSISGAGAITLNLAGVGSRSLQEVSQIR